MNTLPERCWQKSSYSTQVENCVEVAKGETTLVRDTKNRAAGTLVFSVDAFRAMLGSLS